MRRTPQAILLTEFLEKYEKMRAEAEKLGTLAPVAKILKMVLEDARLVDGWFGPDAKSGRLLKTKEASELLGVSPNTVADWCRDGRLEGARRSSGGSGIWLIPASSIYTALSPSKRRERSGRRSLRPNK